MKFGRRVSVPCGKHMTSGTRLLCPIKSHIIFSFGTSTFHCDMENTLPPPVTEEQIMCLPASEESPFMESPKRGSTEWTDEKHSLYLKSMEASFVDQLYDSLDMRNWQTENECSSDSMSSRKIHGSNHCQFKVLQHGFWSRIDYRRESVVRIDVNRPSVSSSNPWIQHFINRDKQGATESLENPSLTSCSNTEVIDQNFVEDSAIKLMNMACSKKRKSTYADSKSSNDQVASSFGHISSNRNH
ncbi:hypothetical protein L1987_80502 [Smallanthus sonchifolius]|uniref:Uncharacterized protein n=1 Tax=Smallanthus sonchifolius TaxID=185202 RepID=A0ACB8YNE1_9ASTR|nr:hypothetical protein L1987_80502 [Smallanthus sonchifolius]